VVTIQQGIAAGTLQRMGEGGLRFHIAGFPVAVPLGGILGVLLIAYLWTPNFSQPGRSGIVLAVVFAVLLYAGVLVHELAHAWAARAFGYPVHGITLWLLGGYTVYERRTSRPWPELVIAVIGPVSTLLLAGLCWVLAEATTGSTSLLLGALAWTNGLLGILNLLPGAPLDGGGVVKSLVWRASGSESTGAKAAGYAGLVIAVLLGVLAVWSFSRGGSGLLLMGVLAVFIGFGAYQSLQSARSSGTLDQIAPRLPHLIRRVLPVSEQESLGAALDRWDRTNQPAVVTVDSQGRLLAVLSPPAAEAVPPERRAEVAIGPFTTAIPADQRVVLDDDPRELVLSMARSGAPLAFVTDPDGRPLGVLFAGDVNKLLDNPG
jgi:Zn-dependent protease